MSRQELRELVEKARRSVGDDVGLDAVMLVGEELPGPAEARLDLIADQQATMGVQQVGGGGQEPRGRREHAVALDRLDDHRRDEIGRAHV